jgi:hypothetical protein
VSRTGCPVRCEKLRETPIPYVTLRRRSAVLLPMHPLDGDLKRRYRVGDHAAEIIHSLERAHFIRKRFTGPYR